MWNPSLEKVADVTQSRWPRKVCDSLPTLPSIFGAMLATRVPTAAIAIVFGVVLLLSAYFSSRPHPPEVLDMSPDRLATAAIRHQVRDRCPVREYRDQPKVSPASPLGL